MVFLATEFWCSRTEFVSIMMSTEMLGKFRETNIHLINLLTESSYVDCKQVMLEKKSQLIFERFHVKL